MKRKRISVNKSRFFIGEMMTCVMCGRQQKSDPDVESNWTVIEQPDDGKAYH